MSELMDRIEDIGQLAHKITTDGKVTIPEGFAFVGEVIEAAATVIRTLEDPQTHFEPLVEDCERLFDRYIEPRDIQGVPHFLEKRVVDPLLRSMIRPAIVRLYELVEE